MWHRYGVTHSAQTGSDTTKDTNCITSQCIQMLWQLCSWPDRVITGHSTDVESSLMIGKGCSVCGNNKAANCVARCYHVKSTLIQQLLEFQ